MPLLLALAAKNSGKPVQLNINAYGKGVHGFPGGADCFSALQNGTLAFVATYMKVVFDVYLIATFLSQLVAVPELVVRSPPRDLGFFPQAEQILTRGTARSHKVE